MIYLNLKNIYCQNDNKWLSKWINSFIMYGFNENETTILNKEKIV